MKKIQLAVINSNYTKIGPYTKKGTEIFDYIFLTTTVKYFSDRISPVAFCSGNSIVPCEKQSVSTYSSIEDSKIGEKNAALYDHALISKALNMKSRFDLFHFNLANGEFILPYAKCFQKPIVITLHGDVFEPYVHKYFSLFKDLKNVYFVPISNFQRKSFPISPRQKTIYHGINIRRFTFHETGGKTIVWTGRAIPEKGLDTLLLVAKKLKKQARVFPIIKNEYIMWLQEILKKRDMISQIVKIHIDFNVTRSHLIKEYQNGKLFLFPLRWEEPFGLTMIESMACGTPIVAFARGSVPEIVKDGVTGFIVNPSSSDIRGDWIIKKTGIEGICEAVEKIYTMTEDEYKSMRKACRRHVEQKFEVKRMAREYLQLYEDILAHKL